MSLPFIFPSTILVIMSTICMVMLHQISPAHAAQHAQPAQPTDPEHVKEGQYSATQRSLLELGDTSKKMKVMTKKLQPSSDCARLESAFRDTDVQQKRGWTAVTTPDSCCSFDGVTCNEIVRPPRITQIILRHKSGGPKLTGSVHMELFQQMSRLEYVSLGHNDFSGNVDLSHLPDSLETLSLHHNNFEGTPSLTNLPSSLQRLHLSDNKFSGCPALSASQLPPLQYLDLRDSGLDISEQDQQEIRQRIQHAFF
mmetsp:Transcript_53824/g.86103  ORF Transcript_53824/g.86103 Transcript_53824/m.86103 type:complete len:254 (-) Transcript_53824:33-794(-)